MFTNRFTKIFTGLLIVVAASVSVTYVSSEISSKRGSRDMAAVANTYLPLPPGRQTQLFNAAQESTDFFQRHPDWTWMDRKPAKASSDYFQRHPELSTQSVLGVGASDYFQRHPGLTVSTQLTMDQTDYYFRHNS